MTTYFITGGFGFLGQYIVKALHEHDPEPNCACWDAHSALPCWASRTWSVCAGFRAACPSQKRMPMNSKAWMRSSITPRWSRFANRMRTRSIKANVVGTRNLAQAAMDAGCKNFIFISSISAVGFNPDGITDETMLPDMEYKRENDMYGFSKRTSEIELIELTDRMRIITLNPSVILGPGSERIEAVFRMARFLPILPMLSYVNSFVDVRDVAQAVILSLTKGRSGERYIVTAHNAEMLDFVRTALKAAGKNPLIFPVAGPGSVCWMRFCGSWIC